MTAKEAEGVFGGFDFLSMSPVPTKPHVAAATDADLMQRKQDAEKTHLEKQLAKAKKDGLQAIHCVRYMEKKSKQQDSEVQRAKSDGAAVLAKQVLKTDKKNKRKVTLKGAVLIDAEPCWLQQLHSFPFNFCFHYNYCTETTAANAQQKGMTVHQTGNNPRCHNTKPCLFLWCSMEAKAGGTQSKNGRKKQVKWAACYCFLCVSALHAY